MTEAGVFSSVDRNFILQQGLDVTDLPSCALLGSALLFQPRAIAVVLVVGALTQSVWVFAVLAAVLWWCALVPSLNPFELIYRHTLGLRPGAALLGPSPPPRRFAQGMAGAFATAIALGLAGGWWLFASVLQVLFLAAVAALVFGRFCLGSFVYHLTHGRVTFAMRTLPWRHGA
jgi:uncharacterized protein DUF4395